MKKFFQFEYEADGNTSEIATPVYLRKNNTTPEVQCKAVWDTGATGSMISASTAKKLTLSPCGISQISGVHGVQNAKCYHVDLVFGNGFCIPKIKVAEASDTGGFELLVGMDVISKGILLIDGSEGELSVRFMYPTEDQPSFSD